MVLVPIFDLDGTLLDSDAALCGAFVALGVPHESVTFGHVPADLRRGGHAPSFRLSRTGNPLPPHAIPR